MYLYVVVCCCWSFGWNGEFVRIAFVDDLVILIFDHSWFPIEVGGCCSFAMWKIWSLRNEWLPTYLHHSMAKTQILERSRPESNQSKEILVLALLFLFSSKGDFPSLVLLCLDILYENYMKIIVSLQKIWSFYSNFFKWITHIPIEDWRFHER